jgi:hypothetical protein
VKFWIDRQLVKANAERICTDAGIQIDLSEMQLKKANRSIRNSRDSAANVTSDNEEHPMKQQRRITSTDAGMQIANNSSQRSKAQYASSFSFDSPANVTMRSLRQCAKHDSPSTSIDEGIQMWTKGDDMNASEAITRTLDSISKTISRIGE